MARHLDLLESSIRNTEQEELRLAWEALVEAGNRDDEAEIEAELQPLRFELEVIHPRYVRSSFLVMLASMMEAALTDIGDAWADLLGWEPVFSKFPAVQSEGFIDRFARFFKEMNSPLILEVAELQRMELLYKLRNKLAHNGGRPLSPSDRRKFQKWSREVPGIEFELGFLSFSEDFVRQMFEGVRGSLAELVTEVRRLRDSRG